MKDRIEELEIKMKIMKRENDEIRQELDVL